MPELVGSIIYGAYAYSADVDTYIDVPVCDFVLVIDATKRYEGGSYSVRLDNKTLTINYVRDPGDGSEGPWVLSYKKPASGSRRFEILAPGNDPLMFDGVYYILFFKGASDFTPVRSIGCDGANDEIILAFTGVKDYDYIVLCAMTEDDALDVEWENATEIRQDDTDYYKRALAYNNDGDNVDITAIAYHVFGGPYYILMLGVVLAPSAVIVWVR